MVTVKRGFHDIDSWLLLWRDHFSQDQIKQIILAIDIATPYYANQKFYPTDVDLMLHSLTCASLVAELNLYADAVIATILFALPKFLPHNWIEKLDVFGTKVKELVDGINKVTQIRKLGGLIDVDNKEERREQIEIVRKMLLAMVSDIRVVLIVLVGRGELMLHLKSCSDEQMVYKIALETVEIFSPIANRLGVWQIKWKLEDLSFKYLHPIEYKDIANLLDETREDRLYYIENIKKYLSMQIKEHGITDYQVMGRAKHIYSIWRKMQKKDYNFQDLYDIRAVRILVPEAKDCYTVLGIVHTKYSPIAGEFDDYISKPKSNNYQSLHTCVVGPDNKVIEVQIRTFAMHNHAEYGVAAHWRYKELGDKGGNHNPAFVEKVAWIRQILDWKDDLTKSKDVTDIFKNEIFNDNVYVMTPTGKVIALPNGSTPIDFAYAIHSIVGHKCRGAKVDGHIVPLSTELQNGQKVEILTAKNGGPSINWLHDGLVKSTKAISHIRRYIRNQNYEEYLASGLEIFERELFKFPSNSRPHLVEIVSKLGYDNDKNVYIDLGKGEIAPTTIRDAIHKLINKDGDKVGALVNDSSVVPFIKTYTKEGVSAKNASSILVDGVTGIVTYIAKCCKPIPGDNIVGFVTQGSGVSIHRDNCMGIKRQSRLQPNKVVPVAWSDNFTKAIFNIDVEVIAVDRYGLLRDLTDLFSSLKLNINALRTTCKNNKAVMLFTIQLTGNSFNFILLSNKIRAISGIIEVNRK